MKFLNIIYKIAFFFAEKYNFESLTSIYIYILSFYSGGLIISYLFYIALYLINNDWIKQFRTTDMLLPWNENPKLWKKLKPKIIKLNVNLIFIIYNQLFLIKI